MNPSILSAPIIDKLSSSLNNGSDPTIELSKMKRAVGAGTFNVLLKACDWATSNDSTSEQFKVKIAEELTNGLKDEACTNLTIGGARQSLSQIEMFTEGADIQETKGGYLYGAFGLLSALNNKDGIIELKHFLGAFREELSTHSDPLLAGRTYAEKNASRTNAFTMPEPARKKTSSLRQKI